MAFENVDTVSLRRALMSCKNSLSYKETEKLIGSISNSTWECEAKKNFKNSVDKLINTHYKDLEKKLDDYLNAVPLIEEYKELDKVNKQLEKVLISLKATYSSNNGKNNEVKKINNRILENKTQMDNLKNRVESLI